MTKCWLESHAPATGLRKNAPRIPEISVLINQREGSRSDARTSAGHVYLSVLHEWSPAEQEDRGFFKMLEKKTWTHAWVMDSEPRTRKESRN